MGPVAKSQSADSPGTIAILDEPKTQRKRKGRDQPADSLPITKVRGFGRSDGGAVRATRADARNAFNVLGRDIFECLDCIEFLSS